MTTRIRSVEGNSQRLDGGAMFGNCPQAVWRQWAAPDSLNRIPLACRGLLVSAPSGNVLYETGVGAFFEPKLQARFGVDQSHHVLLESIATAGITPEQVDAIVLSHLHFDHAGGLLTPWKEGESLSLAFPNAKVIVSKDAWNRANQPHARDRASYIPELHRLLEESGRLEIVTHTQSSIPGVTFTFSEGHTPGLMLAKVPTPQGPITFAGDLIPGVAWVHLPITMGYDRFPERLIEEKKTLLDEVIAEDGWLFFTHDPDVSLAKIERSSSGKYQAVQQVKNVDWSFD